MLLDAARRLVDRAVREAEEAGLKLAFVILDQTFAVVCAVRMDGAQRSTYGAALAKATTALNFNAPSRAVKERILPENRISLQIADPALMFIGGGAPIVRDGVPIGAIGISGGPEAADAEFAERLAASVD